MVASCDLRTGNGAVCILYRPSGPHGAAGQINIVKAQYLLTLKLTSIVYIFMLQSYCRAVKTYVYTHYSVLLATCSSLSWLRSVKFY